ncbi:uncharacterized protein LOC142603695 [Balearica regulorum gibbericeps]|uniref:uncharacterized protein LOC142603695 n=1 Tax=Balearica regulorum gibbericeps TaxID=100784 RepID=UPI003F619C98
MSSLHQHHQDKPPSASSAPSTHRLQEPGQGLSPRNTPASTFEGVSISVGGMWIKVPSPVGAAFLRGRAPADRAAPSLAPDATVTPSPVVGRSRGGGSHLTAPWAAGCDGCGCAAGPVLAGMCRRLPGTEPAGTWQRGWKPPCDPPAAVGFRHPQERVRAKEEVYPSGGSAIRTPGHVELYQTRSGPAGCLGGEGFSLARRNVPPAALRTLRAWRLTVASPSGTFMDPPRAVPGAALLRRRSKPQHRCPVSRGCSGTRALSPRHAGSSGCTGLGSAVGGAIPPLHPWAGKSCNPGGFGPGGEKKEEDAVGCCGCRGCCGQGCPGTGRAAGAAGHCQVTSAGARKSDSRCIRSAVLQFQFHRLTIIFRLLLVPH